MNLNEMLREPKASLVDHDWYEYGLLKDGKPTFTPEGLKNNKKDELEVQWGYGHIEPEYSVENQRALSGIVERNLENQQEENQSDVIVFARDLMNSGVMGSELTSKLRNRFTIESLRKASKELSSLFTLEGIVGCIAIDTRGYKDPRVALDLAGKSQHKKYIKYVIADKKDSKDYAWMPSGVAGQVSVANSSGNAVDDFFDVKGHRASLIPHCKQTMMPILFAGNSEINEEDMDETLIELVNLGSISEDELSVIESKHGAKIARVQAAFRFIDRKRDVKRKAAYSERVGNSDFVIDREDKEIDIESKFTALDANIDQVNDPNFINGDFELESGTVEGDLDVSVGSLMEW